MLRKYVLVCRHNVLGFGLCQLHRRADGGRCEQCAVRCKLRNVAEQRGMVSICINQRCAFDIGSCRSTGTRLSDAHRR